jgi:hypothetical protein
MKDTDPFGIKDAADRILLSSIDEDTILSIVYRNKGEINLLEILKDERIPLQKRGLLNVPLLLLKDKGYLKTNGVIYRITLKGKILLLYNYKGWGAIAAILSLIAIFISVYPHSSDPSKNLPRQDIKPRIENMKIQVKPRDTINTRK